MHKENFYVIKDMNINKISSRSKSSASLIINPNSLYQKVYQSLTPNSRKTSIHKISIPYTATAKNSKKKIAFNEKRQTLKSVYVPSYLRSSSKNLNLKELSHDKLISPYKKLNINTKRPNSIQGTINLFRGSPFSKPIPKKNLVIKVKKKSNLNENNLENCIKCLSARTKIGSINGRNKLNNQDNYFIFKNFADSKNQNFLGIMDGHGLLGHDVSNFVKQRLPILIEKSLPEEGNFYTVKYPLLSKEGISKLRILFDKTFVRIHNFLEKKHINFSGTTLNTVYMHGTNCICSNVGDSRAIIGRFSNEWEAIQLSYDHKPNNEYEKLRIECSGGRVEPFKEVNGLFIGPPRVWLKYEQLPGLAMSRSIGDLVANSVGVIPNPDIFFHNLISEDKFLVIASDGVWEFISNITCVRIIAEFYEKNDIDNACTALMNYAEETWRKNDTTRDDITFIIVFLNIL